MKKNLTKKKIEEMLGQKFGPNEEIKIIEDGITWTTDPCQKDEPINRYDICLLENIWLCIEAYGLELFEMSTDVFKNGLDHDSIIIDGGYKNTIADVEWSIGKLITQEYLEGLFVVNCNPPFSAVKPTKKSRELLPEVYYRMLEATKNRIQ